LPFAYSPYRLDIEAATRKLAANECIVLMKISVKKNRYFNAIFFARGSQLDARLQSRMARRASLRSSIAAHWIALNTIHHARIAPNGSIPQARYCCVVAF
jgi:hypothetical protein